jgi:hypothetical protein
VSLLLGLLFGCEIRSVSSSEVVSEKSVSRRKFGLKWNEIGVGGSVDG